MPAPAASAYTLAPRAFACSSDSSTRTAAPSPSTKPSRPLSHGREAAAGSSLRLDSAIMLPKAAIGSGWMAASVPPTTTTSARPSRIMSMPSAIASLPDAQAETGRVHAGLGADGEADVRGRGVRHQHRDRQRRDPARALLLERVVVGQQRLHAADAGGHRDPETLGVDLGVGEAGVGPGLEGGDQRELAGAVEAARLDALEHVGGVDGDLGGDLGAELLGPVVLDRGAPRTLRRGGRPRSWARHRRRGRSCRVRSRRREWRSCLLHLMVWRGSRGRRVATTGEYCGGFSDNGVEE